VRFAAKLLREYDTIGDAILTCAQKLIRLSQFNLPQGESVESVLKMKMKAMVGRICRKGRF